MRRIFIEFSHFSGGTGTVTGQHVCNTRAQDLILRMSSLPSHCEIDKGNAEARYIFLKEENVGEMLSNKLNDL